MNKNINPARQNKFAKGHIQELKADPKDPNTKFYVLHPKQ